MAPCGTDRVARHVGLIAPIIMLLLRLSDALLSFSVRPALKSDTAHIRARVLREKMNPLFLEWNNFLVAESDGGDVIGCAQIRPISSPESDDGSELELASLVVDPPHRGCGVGSSIVKELLRTRRPAGSSVYLTTLSRTASFYERLGFRKINLNEVPLTLRLEVAAGSFVAAAVADDALSCLLVDDYSCDSDNGECPYDESSDDNDDEGARRGSLD